MEWEYPEEYDFENGNQSGLYWIIIYPKGDRTKLSVAELCDGTSYEESDYDMASRKHFRDEQMANVYCRKLAKENGLDCDANVIAILD
jgi:hypothetical protein